MDKSTKLLSTLLEATVKFVNTQTRMVRRKMAKTEPEAMIASEQAKTTVNTDNQVFDLSKSRGYFTHLVSMFK